LLLEKFDQELVSAREFLLTGSILTGTTVIQTVASLSKSGAIRHGMMSLFVLPLGFGIMYWKNKTAPRLTWPTAIESTTKELDEEASNLEAFDAAMQAVLQGPPVASSDANEQQTRNQ
jgi:hypothetical protein